MNAQEGNNKPENPAQSSEPIVPKEAKKEESSPENPENNIE